jgi:hypothetical protein
MRATTVVEAAEKNERNDRDIWELGGEIVEAG